MQVRQLSEVSRNNGPKHAGAVNPKKMEPKDFSGDVLKFKRWREDVEDWMKMKFPGIEKLMKKFREKNEVTREELDAHAGEMHLWDDELYNCFKHYTEEEPHTIVQHLRWKRI